VNALLAAGANPLLKNDEGKLAHDLTTDSAIQGILKQAALKFPAKGAPKAIRAPVWEDEEEEDEEAATTPTPKGKGQQPKTPQPAVEEEEEEEEAKSKGKARSTRPQESDKTDNKDPTADDDSGNKPSRSVGRPRKPTSSGAVGRPRKDTPPPEEENTYTVYAANDPDSPSKKAREASDPNAPLPSDVNKRDRTGRSPLHKASHSGDSSLVQRLIDAGSDVNARDHGGWTPLHAAALKGYDVCLPPKKIIKNKQLNSLQLGHCVDAD